MVMEPGDIAIIGTRFYFGYTDGDRYYYEGVIDNSTSLTGNIGMKGKYVYYRDENGNVRRLGDGFIGDSGYDDMIGEMWVSDSDIITVYYIDENGVKKAIQHG